jgi:hypothetical protein
VIQSWCGSEGLRKSIENDKVSPWRRRPGGADSQEGSKPADDLAIKCSVDLLCNIVACHSSPHGRRAIHERFPDLTQLLLKIGKESNPRHHSILAFVTVACLGQPENRAHKDRAPIVAPLTNPGPMVSALVQSFLEATAGNNNDSQSHVNLVAEAMYELSRSVRTKQLLLRHPDALQSMLDAVERYRGPWATEVADSLCRALLQLALDSHGRVALEQLRRDKHPAAVLDEIATAEGLDPHTQLHAQRAAFAMRLPQQEVERRPRTSVHRVSGAPRVMISYTRADAKKAVALASALRRLGEDVQLEDASVLGGNTAQQLATQVDECGAMLLCCSSQYVESARCQLEVQYARARKVRPPHHLHLRKALPVSLRGEPHCLRLALQGTAGAGGCHLGGLWPRVRRHRQLAGWHSNAQHRERILEHGGGDQPTGAWC